MPFRKGHVYHVPGSAHAHGAPSVDVSGATGSSTLSSGARGAPVSAAAARPERPSRTPAPVAHGNIDGDASNDESVGRRDAMLASRDDSALGASTSASLEPRAASASAPRARPQHPSAIDVYDGIGQDVSGDESVDGSDEISASRGVSAIAADKRGAQWTRNVAAPAPLARAILPSAVDAHDLTDDEECGDDRSRHDDEIPAASRRGDGSSSSAVSSMLHLRSAPVSAYARSANASAHSSSVLHPAARTRPPPSASTALRRRRPRTSRLLLHRLRCFSTAGEFIPTTLR